jgi:hypothetical protein
VFAAFPFAAPYFAEAPSGAVSDTEVLDLFASTGGDLELFGSASTALLLWASDSGDLALFGSDGDE